MTMHETSGNDPVVRAGGDGPGRDGAAQGRRVRDREVVLLAALCVVIVLGLQLLGILVPAFQDAIGRPPTMIVVLVVVTAVVFGRAVWALLRH